MAKNYEVSMRLSVLADSLVFHDNGKSAISSKGYPLSGASTFRFGYLKKLCTIPYVFESLSVYQSLCVSFKGVILQEIKNANRLHA